MALYVDDGLIIDSSMDKINKLLQQLKSYFEIKLNEVNYYLRLEISRDRHIGFTHVYQTAYITKFLEKFNMTNCNSVSVPMDAHVIFKRDYDEDGNIIINEDIPYRQLIGSLMYLVVGTRPDIIFAVSKLS